jgi:hypothetical protein
MSLIVFVDFRAAVFGLGFVIKLLRTSFPPMLYSGAFELTSPFFAFIGDICADNVPQNKNAARYVKIFFIIIVFVLLLL